MLVCVPRMCLKPKKDLLCFMIVYMNVITLSIQFNCPRQAQFWVLCYLKLHPLNVYSRLLYSSPVLSKASDFVLVTIAIFTINIVLWIMQGLCYQMFSLLILGFCIVDPDLGLPLWSQGEPGFHWFGFIMCISATAARAFKSVLQGILLSSEG